VRRKYLTIHENGDVTYEENGKEYTDTRKRKEMPYRKDGENRDNVLPLNTYDISEYKQ
jgi:hypothetical protein